MRELRKRLMLAASAVSLTVIERHMAERKRNQDVEAVAIEELIEASK